MNKAGWLMAAVAAGALAQASAAAAQSASPAPSRSPTAKPIPPAPAPADGPILPDEEFNKELPPLDPDLTRPLEPLESFEVGVHSDIVTRPARISSAAARP